MEIEYKGEKLHIATRYRENGQEILVFLPGLGCLKESFTDAWNIDSLQKYSLLTIDYIGHGESSHSQRFPYTMEDHAAIVSIVLSYLKKKQIHIVAHSMGGAIGVLVAEQLGTRLKTFVNVEGNLISEDCGILSRKTISVSYEEFRKTIFGQLQELMTTSEEKGSQLWVTWSRETDPYAFYKSAESLVAWSDSNKLLTKFLSLSAKKAYIYGEKNLPSLTKQLNQLHQIPSFGIPGSGHFVMNDNPQKFYSKISELVK
jgi:pimeloyl-ACP methyl ester carboxylesterase